MLKSLRRDSLGSDWATQTFLRGGFSVDLIGTDTSNWVLQQIRVAARLDLAIGAQKSAACVDERLVEKHLRGQQV